MKKSVFLFLLFLFLSSLSFCAQIATIANCSKIQDVYPGDSIQEAIDSAQPGDTIIVHAGTYREHVVVNKKVSLVGEDKHNTIIDWNGIGSVVHVTADNTVIANFTLTLASRSNAYPDSGIHSDHSSGNNIINNIMIANYRGLYLDESFDNTITGNDIKNNDYGICLYDSSSNNIISGNSIANNEKGIYLRRSSNNIIHHNSFINNTKQVDDFYLDRRPSRLSKNFWDDDYPSGGNYWSDYTGEDANGDGIGDNAYFIYQENQDRYPLVPDLVPPSISIATPENKTYAVTTIPLTFTVNEATSWMGYSLDRQANNTIAGNITLIGLSDGPHSLAVYARDILGNIGSSGTVYFTVDTKAPSILLISPTNTAYPSNSIPLRFVVEETASWVGYSLDGQKNVTVSGNTTLVALSEGIHTITIYVTDATGNLGYSGTALFTVDTISPDIEILSPENKTHATNSVSLSFIINEPTSWIGYSLDRQTNVTIIGNVTISGLSEGAHTVKLCAEDTTGNMGASSVIHFTIRAYPIDFKPPTILIVSPENKTYDITDIPLTLTADETISGIAYSLDGQKNVTITGEITSSACVHVLSGLPEGSHTLIVYARDTAGNAATSEIIYFVVEPKQTESSQLWVVAVIAIVAGLAFAFTGYLAYDLFRTAAQHDATRGRAHET